MTIDRDIVGNGKMPIAPNAIGPNLSPDYLSTGLSFNTGTLVHAIATPYNDQGDKYHVVVDFTGTTNG